MKIKDLLGILLFCVVLRAACTLLIISRYPESDYYLDLIFQAGMEIFLILLCSLLMKISLPKIKNIVGRTIGIQEAALAVAAGVILILFTFGENGIEALIVAQFNPQKVFKIWNFHTTAREVYPLFSLNVLSFLAVSCLVAPICEELFFRGFLLSTLLEKKSLYSALIINCSIFTVLHFSHEYYVSTFVFSLFLCCAYLVTRSIVFCSVAHSTFNFLGLMQNYSLNEYFVRSIDSVASPSSWILEISSFLVSVLIISRLFFRFLKNYDVVLRWGE